MDPFFLIKGNYVGISATFTTDEIVKLLMIDQSQACKQSNRYEGMR